MHTKYVADSSTLISLAKIGAIGLLDGLAPIACPQDVFEETVVEGAARGFADSLMIRKAFDRKTLVATAAGIGSAKTDEKVLEMARHSKAILLCNDVKLGRNAQAAGILVLGSPDVCLLKKETGEVNEDEYRKLIRKLVEKKRLTKETAEKYLG